MPKVRILSGSQAGVVMDLPLTEAEVAISYGFAEFYQEPPAKPKAPVMPEPTAKPEPPAKPKKDEPRAARK